MRLPLLPVILLLVFNGLVDWYICRAVARRCRGPKAPLFRGVAFWSSVAFALLLILVIVLPKRNGGDEQLRGIMWALYAYFSVYFSKIVFLVFDLLSRIPALFRRRRIKALGRVGAAAGVLCFVAMWWGALVTVRQTDVRRVEVEIPDLPASFDGYTIAQISDFHTGTYGCDTSFVSKVVRDVNGLEPDVIVFTGDIVNRRSSELEPFVPTLSRLSAPAGVYSVLGNHDYGDYMDWPDARAKEENLDLLKDLQARMGWKMLNNATDTLRNAAGDSIMLIGVENVGDPPFRTYGDLDAAYPGDLVDPNVKILLSHNPAHWTDDIQDAPDKNIALTLSGHTHAMQIRVLGMSPSRFRYPTWGGLYADSDNAHKLYVNIGLGEVAFPARIGATPEITLITLRRK